MIDSIQNAQTTVYPAQHSVPAEVDKLLVTILSWPRPHDSYAEKKFRSWLAAQIKAADKDAAVLYLGGGSLYVEPAVADTPYTQVLFSCHIDTVDSSISGAPRIVKGKETHKVKKLTYDPNFGVICLDKATETGTCLGADDGVGVWLMLEMIRAGVPGGYIFHTGEECGGVGSRAMAADYKSVLEKYKVALAFDRPHNDEVITHQRGQECASKECGDALCGMLNDFGFKYATSTKGVFTDTANYRKLIPECFNLGVGYDSQHGVNEMLDYAHAAALKDALLGVHWNELPVKRDHLKPDPVPVYEQTAKWRGRDSYAGMGLFDDGEWPRRTVTPFKPKVAPPKYEDPRSGFDDLMTRSLEDILYDMDQDPDYAADTVESLMVEVGRLRAEIAVLRAMKGGAK